MENKEKYILIVDDNTTTLQFAGKILKNEGFQISLAKDGESAISLLKENNFDLVLLDIMMPGINGIEVCKKIKTIDTIKDTPIVFLTAKTQPEDLVEGFGAGGNDYITKPFNKEELLARVLTHIELGVVRKQLSESIVKLKNANEKIVNLFHNIFPIKIAEDLLRTGFSLPKTYNNVSLIAVDIVDFTEKARVMQNAELFEELNSIFAEFDSIVEKHEAIRIKTSGDGYLAVCGIPEENANHASNIVNSAIEIHSFIKNRNLKSGNKWEIRMGLHTGQVIGGIVGNNRFVFDIFGNAVNIVFRLEKSAEPMKIFLSEDLYQILKPQFNFIESKEINTKGYGKIKTYLLNY
ncbi:MAG: response regulator [Bacteroidales bacterium]|nr:response regulator [Bacteroidales bacterium]